MREFTFCNDGERGRLVGFHAYDLGDSAHSHVTEH